MNESNSQASRSRQFRLKTRLLLAIPAALIAAMPAKWFDAGPDFAKPSAAYELTEGNSLERMFASLVPTRSFAQTRRRGGAREITPRSGRWTRQFEGGLWSSEAEADRALKQFQTMLQDMLRERGGDIRDQQVRLAASRMNGFRFIYLIGDHLGRVEVYYGPESIRPDSRIYRRPYVNIDEQTGLGEVDEFRWEPSSDDVSDHWQPEP